MTTIGDLNITNDLLSLQRFFTKIEKTNNCWIWKSALNAAKYGVFRAKGSARLAHRISYTIFKGEIPEGLQLDHLCKNTMCVNPEHLEAVTGKINNARSNSPTARNAKKTHCPQGHEYTPENTLKNKLGRSCKTCTYNRIEIYQSKNKDLVRIIKRNYKIRQKLKKESMRLNNI